MYYRKMKNDKYYEEEEEDESRFLFIDLYALIWRHTRKKKSPKVTLRKKENTIFLGDSSKIKLSLMENPIQDMCEEIVLI